MMRSTGIVRKIDELGRIVLPKELRDTLNMPDKTPLEIFIDDANRIVLQKYEPGCIFCGDTKEITTYKGKNVCPACLKGIGK